MDTAGAKKKTLDMSGLLDLALSFEKENDCKVIMADARYVAGEEHLLCAYEHAVRAFDNGLNRTKDVAMETLLYVTGDRQISKAMGKVGKIDNASGLALLTTGDNIDALIEVLGFERDDSVLNVSAEKLDRIGITEVERGTVAESQWGDLVLERVALSILS